MDSDLWYHRLVKAIEDDDRSMREISQEAGCGPNYVQQMLADEKKPGVKRLMALLEVLGGSSAMHVLMGFDISDSDLELLGVARALKPDLRADALRHFRALANHADVAEPPFS